MEELSETATSSRAKATPDVVGGVAIAPAGESSTTYVGAVWERESNAAARSGSAPQSFSYPHSSLNSSFYVVRAGAMTSHGAATATCAPGAESGVAVSGTPIVSESAHNSGVRDHGPVVETVSSSDDSADGSGAKEDTCDSSVISMNLVVDAEVRTAPPSSTNQREEWQSTQHAKKDRNSAYLNEVAGGGRYKQMNDAGEGRNGDEDDGQTDKKFSYNDAEIQRDAADDFVAFIVHVALAFFAFIFMCAVVGSILLVSQYGFLTLLINLSLVAIVFGSGYFVSKSVMSDKQLKPIRRKMRRWKAVAEAVVIKELRDFQFDLNRHLLLMDAEMEETDDTDDFEEDKHEEDLKVERQNEQVVPDVQGQTATSETLAAVGRSGNSKRPNGSNKKEKNDEKPRSMFFGLVKPFIRPKGKRKGLFNRKNGKKADESSQYVDGYVPPAASATMT